FDYYRWNEPIPKDSPPWGTGELEAGKSYCRLFGGWSANLPNWGRFARDRTTNGLKKSAPSDQKPEQSARETACPGWLSGETNSSRKVAVNILSALKNAEAAIFKTVEETEREMLSVQPLRHRVVGHTQAGPREIGNEEDLNTF
ncbi:MAG: hypothetical protein WB762_28810, partial [Candidatus Sulfotelmatobacter sp.]